jgi:hypothetical protein
MRDDQDEGSGCFYRLAGADEREAACGMPRRPASAYCPRHHELCRIPLGSLAESLVLVEWEALATAIGGRYGAPAREPPPAVLRRLDTISRSFSRPKSSCYVHGGTMPRRLHKPLEKPSSADIAPTKERERQGLVERLSRPIPDAAGRPARPYRAVDTLAVMERRGSITAGMRQAGEDFRTRFARAQFDPLRALDLTHLRIAETGTRPGREAPGPRIEAARRTVWRAIQVVGGIASPAGSCLWHVIGWELPVKEWALQQGWSGRRVSQETASGILIAALGALESHLGNQGFLR